MKCKTTVHLSSGVKQYTKIFGNSCQFFSSKCHSNYCAGNIICFEK